MIINQVYNIICIISESDIKMWSVFEEENLENYLRNYWNNKISHYWYTIF